MKEILKSKINFIIILLFSGVLFVDKILNILPIADFILINPPSILSVTDGFQWNL